MNITLSISGELEKVLKSHQYIKWTEIAREAMRLEAEKLKKLEIMQKYMEKKKISEEEWRWMDAIDWHPVDETSYKPEFAKDVVRASRGKCKKIKNLEDLLK